MAFDPTLPLEQGCSSPPNIPMALSRARCSAIWRSTSREDIRSERLSPAVTVMALEGPLHTSYVSTPSNLTLIGASLR